MDRRQFLRTASGLFVAAAPALILPKPVLSQLSGGVGGFPGPGTVHSAGSSPATTWDADTPAKKSTRITLSNVNLTARVNTGNYGAVLSEAATTASQLVYVEFVIDTVVFGPAVGFGNASTTGLDAQLPGISSTSTAFYFSNYNGGTFKCVDSANNDAAVFTVTAGDNVGIAFNTSTGRVWARKNGGAWSNSGDPAAGTNGYAVPFAGPYYAIAHGGDTNDQVTAKFASSSWTYSAPSGYSQLAA